MNARCTKFIDEVLKHIKYKKIHKSISQELEDHIECIKDDYMQPGMSEDEAYEKAIVQMGQAESVGEELNRTHKIKMEWSIIIPIIAILGINLITLFSVSELAGGRFEANLRWIVLGVIGFTVAYRFNYRKYEKYCIIGYILGLSILILLVKIGKGPNGSIKWIEIGQFPIEGVTIAFIMIMISYAGLVRLLECSDIKQCIKLGIVAIVPVCILSRCNIVQALMLGTCLLVMLTSHIMGSEFKGNRKHILGFIYGGIGVIGSIFIFLIKRSDMHMERLRGFLNPELNPMDGFLYTYNATIRESANLIGGTNLDINPVKNIIDSGGDGILLFIISVMGWIAGILLIGIIVFMIIRMFISSSKVHDTYGRLLTISICTIFVIRFVVHIGMNLGYLPLVSMQLPFLSMYGSAKLYDSILLGIYLSVYKRKDVVLYETLV